MEIIAPENVHPARGYAHATRVGNTIYVAGQIGLGQDGQVAAGGFEPQARQAFENLGRVLAAAGATPKQVVKVIQVVRVAIPELMIEIEAVAVVE